MTRILAVGVPRDTLNMPRSEVVMLRAVYDQLDIPIEGQKSPADPLRRDQAGKGLIRS